MKHQVKLKSMNKEIYKTEQTIYEESTLREGILLVPDLSGFTEFVANFEWREGEYITRSLLESIVMSNDLDFLISEIEGDAVLFYKFDNLPGLIDLKEQIETMYRSFKNKLDALSEELQVKIPLSIKFIIHYGSFSTYSIGKFNKLYGFPVIQAHQMLKSRITVEPPYALFSKEFVADYGKMRVTEDIITYASGFKHKYVPDIGVVVYL